jgi:pimeloyl-ACP methyl ester carboxylesterase
MQDLTRIGDVTEIKIDDKRTLRYLKAGNGDPLILMHTIRTQLDYFQQVIPELAKHYTIYAVDLPGHGYSSIDSNANYDEPYFREAVIKFIEKLDLNDVTLAGESIGAVLSLTVASSIPERIKQVVASNTYDYETRYADGARRGNFFANFVLGNYQRSGLGPILAENENWLFLGLVLRGGLRNKGWMPNPLLKQLLLAGRRKGFSYVARNVFENWRSWSEARSLYSGVKAPVKLIYGAHDWSTVQERQRTAKELGNIDIMTIENTGHFAFVDKPEKLVDTILENVASA